MEKMNVTKLRIKHIGEITGKEMCEISGMWLNEKSIGIFNDIKVAMTYWIEQAPDQDFDLREIIDFSMPATRLERAVAVVETGLDDRAVSLIGLDTAAEVNEKILSDAIGRTVTAIAHAIEKDAI